MTTWNLHASDLFLEAQERASSIDRQQFLDYACAGDAALRAEVEALRGWTSIAQRPRYSAAFVPKPRR